MWEQFYRLHLKHSKVGLSNFAHGQKIVLYPLIQGCEKASMVPQIQMDRFSLETSCLKIQN